MRPIVIAALLLSACGPSAQEIVAQKARAAATKAAAAAKLKREKEAEEERKTVARLKRQAVQNFLDPSSAQFRNLHLTKGELCGEYNGKNAYGAYIGFDKFYTIFSTTVDVGHLERALAQIQAEEPDYQNSFVAKTTLKWEDCQNDGKVVE
jgi:hypothetical protein